MVRNTQIGLADILFLRKTEAGLVKLEQIVEKEEKQIIRSNA